MGVNVNYLNLGEFVASRKLVLFGASKGGMEAINMIGNSATISYVCDNDRRTHGKSLLGIEIRSPDVLKNEDKNNLIVIISSMYSKDISFQLATFGVKTILVHKELLSFLKNQTPVSVVNVVGKEFHLDINDKEIINNISTLFSIIEDDEFSNELLKFVINERIKKDEIDWAFIRASRINAPKYFSHELYANNNENEIIIDGGLLNTSDFTHFYDCFGKRLKKVYGFEPDEVALETIKRRLSSIQVIDFNEKSLTRMENLVDIKLYPFALSDSSKKVVFRDGLVVEEGIATTSIESRAIDEIIDENEVISLIKLDIEGSELAALKGAIKTIIKNKPRLIVCLYHRPSDLWEIPIFIKELVPEYKLYVRPHDGHKGILELHAV